MILFAGTVHLENWYRDQTDLPDDYVIATSPTGWNNEVSNYIYTINYLGGRVNDFWFLIK
jgi:hypothetical protein